MHPGVGLHHHRHPTHLPAFRCLTWPTPKIFPLSEVTATSRLPRPCLGDQVVTRTFKIYFPNNEYTLLNWVLSWRCLFVTFEHTLFLSFFIFSFTLFFCMFLGNGVRWIFLGAHSILREKKYLGESRISMNARKNYINKEESPLEFSHWLNILEIFGEELSRW